MNIPFVDLRPQHDEVRGEIERAIASAIDESAFVGGPAVSSFEEEFALFCGTKHAIAVASGTDALEFAFRAAGVGPGDAVITVPNTFIATVEAFRQLGAEPIFIDIEPQTYGIDVKLLHEYLAHAVDRNSADELIEKSTGRRVAALAPVHLYGLPADMPAIQRVASHLGLKVIEDSCQAHGARSLDQDGLLKRAGTSSLAGCFSFYPGKNLGALGEAGAIVTDDDSLAESARLLRNHGELERYISMSPDGVNGRMDAIQARVLSIKLAKLDEWNCARRQVAWWYNEALAGSAICVPVEPESREHVYHLYVVRVPDRDRVRQALTDRGIATGLHYPVPIHLQPGFSYLGLPIGSYPETERAANEILSLPMYPHLSREQVEFVAHSLLEVL